MNADALLKNIADAFEAADPRLTDQEADAIIAVRKYLDTKQTVENLMLLAFADLGRADLYTDSWEYGARVRSMQELARLAAAINSGQEVTLNEVQAAWDIAVEDDGETNKRLEEEDD